MSQYNPQNLSMQRPQIPTPAPAYQLNQDGVPLTNVHNKVPKLVFVDYQDIPIFKTSHESPQNTRVFNEWSAQNHGEMSLKMEYYIDLREQERNIAKARKEMLVELKKDFNDHVIEAHPELFL